MDKNKLAVHPLIPELRELLRKGRIERREFLRTASLLGLSAGAAAAMAGVPPLARQAMAQTAAPKRGGNIRVSMNVKAVNDPATFDWGQMGNTARHVIEPLVRIDGANRARPHLAESWQASPDLKTWTFKLRQGVKWSNGDNFGADDVIFNINRWLDPKTGSSNMGRFSSMVTATDTGKKDDKGKPIISRSMTPGAVEKIDDRTVRLHLNRAEIALPESFGDYPALIAHRRFAESGGNFAKDPVGTGPFALKEFKVGDKAVLTRRPAPYWGGDVHLDQITYIDHGDDPAAMVAAFASDQIDTCHQASIEQIDALKSLPNVVVLQTVTAQTGVARMKISEKPFDNKLVRKAFQASIDRERVLELVYRGLGAAGEDHHVAPIHPEYVALPKLKQDHALARKLLADAGHPNGIDLKIDCVAQPTWEQNACKAMAEMCKPAGINLAINIMPGGTYWDRWLTTPFGFTNWTHRPLGVQVLNLAYRSGAPWNETGFSNAAFDAALNEAGGEADPEARRKHMAKLQGILQEEAVIVQPLWRSVFVGANKRVRGLYAQVALEHHYERVWLA